MRKFVHFRSFLFISLAEVEVVYAFWGIGTSVPWNLYSCTQEPSKKPNIFSPLRMRADLNNFWWTWEPTRRTFKKMETFFFCRKKFRIHKPKFRVVNSEFFSAKKKRSPIFSKVRRVGSQVHQKLFKSARILSGEKNLKLGTPIEIATWRQQDQAIWGLWSGPCLP